VLNYESVAVDKWS